MRVGRANSRYLNSYWATTVLHTLPRLRGVAMSGSSSCDRIESLCCSGRASVGRTTRDGKQGTASAVVTRPFALGICGICEIDGCPELVCSMQRPRESMAARAAAKRKHEGGEVALQGLVICGRLLLQRLLCAHMPRHAWAQSQASASPWMAWCWRMRPAVVLSAPVGWAQGHACRR